MGMTVCDLNDNLDCLDDIHQGKLGNSILFTFQLKPLWTIILKRFHNSLKAKDSSFHKPLVALVVDDKFGLD